MIAAVAVAAAATVVLAVMVGDPSSPASDPVVSSTVAPDGGGGAPWLAPATELDPSYPMESLSCAAMTAQIRLDICGVFDGATGRFMVVGAEAYWDPAEPDLDGVVRVPLVITVYVLEGQDTEDGDAVAAPVLTGIIAVPFDASHNEIGLYLVGGDDTPEGADETAVLVWTERTTLRDDATEQIQIVSFAGRTPSITVAGTDAANPFATDSPALLNSYAFPRARTLART